MSWTVSGVGRAPTLFQIAGAPAAAYSLRQLDLVDQPVVRVRRSSDNTEQDFTAVQVTDGTLTTFCGAGNGFVRTWYDQSGNGRNAVQTTNGNQPQIVSSGVVNLANSKPCLTFNGTSNELTIANRPLTGTAAYSVVSVATYGTTGSYGMLFIQSDGTGFLGRLEIRRDSTNNKLEFIGGTDNSTPLVGSAGINNTQRLIQVYGESTGYSAYVNTTLDLVINRTLLPIVDANCGIGARNGNFYFAGSIQEIVVWRSSFLSTRSALQSNINAHFAIY